MDNCIVIWHTSDVFNHCVTINSYTEMRDFDIMPYDIRCCRCMKMGKNIHLQIPNGRQFKPRVDFLKHDA